MAGIVFTGIAGVARLAAVVSPPQQESTTFHIGTRLVEIEVVVRGQRIQPPGVGEWFKWVFDSGPPFGPPGPSIQGLTKDDFALFDDGRLQQISIFRAGPGETNAMLVPPGAVSNRQDSRGRPLNGATVVLIDFLNTGWGLSEYARLGMTKFLRSLTEADSEVAVYSLGKNLHVLQDFTDDPQKLIADFAEMDRPNGHASPALAGVFKDFGDLPTAPVTAWGAHAAVTMNALKSIVQHLSGMPGRKSLVWPMMPVRVGVVSIDGPARRYGGIPTKQVTDLLVRSNIILYPVVMRSEPLDIQRSTAEVLAAATGGRAFFDALDIPFALKTAEEDERSSYVLGYYPAEEMLDGKHHNITVKLKDEKLSGTYEFHYRTGYDATKTAAVPAPPTLSALFNNPLQATNIGLVGRATRDAQHPGFYDVELTVDLRDIHLDRKDGVFTGAFDVSLSNASPSLGAARTVQTRRIDINLPEAELAGALESGGAFHFAGVVAQSGEIRVVVRDRANGVGGSLRIPAGAAK